MERSWDFSISRRKIHEDLCLALISQDKLGFAVTTNSPNQSLFLVLTMRPLKTDRELDSLEPLRDPGGQGSFHHMCC